MLGVLWGAFSKTKSIALNYALWFYIVESTSMPLILWSAFMFDKAAIYFPKTCRGFFGGTEGRLNLDLMNWWNERNGRDR